MGRRRRRSKTVPQIIQNSQALPMAVRNSGQDFTAGMQQWGLAFPQGLPYTSNLSQPNTIFHNMRYWLISNLRQMLSEAYVELALVQNIVNVPVDDGLRGGVDITTQQLDEGQISLLQAKIDEDGDILTAGDASKWDRLFGGAGIMIMTDQDPMKPFDIDSIDSWEDVKFRAVDMWELAYGYQEVGEYNASLQDETFEYYDYYGEQVHKSRVLPLKGILAPSFVRPRLRGWGVSIVETLVRSINQYLKASDLVYEVLDEFKVDVYKINNLVASNFAPGGADNGSVKDRVELVNWQKNFQNAIVLDSEDDWDHKQLNFTGLAEAQAGIRMQVASDMRIPMTKLFGMSAQGFNSGEDDIEVYNAMVESSVRNKLKYPILQMLKIRCQQLFGFVPDDLAITFKPLRVLSSEQEENVKTQKFNRLLQSLQAGAISARLFLDACNRGNLFDVKIDTNKELLGLDTAEEDQARSGKAEFSPRTTKREKDDDDNVLPFDRSRARRGGQKNSMKNRRIANSHGSVVPRETLKPTMDLIKQFHNKVGVTILPNAYTTGERFKRAFNSTTFDRKSYEADGGDLWIDSRRREFFEEPLGVDQELWAKARVRSKQVYGEVRWQFVTWMYRKLGGKFAA